MKMIAALALSAAAASLVAPPLTAAPRKPARHRAAAPSVPVVWTSRVTLTADGGFLVGNPAAKAKLVEYGSISCPYCRRTYMESRDPLRARIATGTVSFEFRPFPVHSADPILHALLRCAGPAHFNAFADDFYADQDNLAKAWEDWAQANPSANPNAGAAMRIAMAEQWGFTAFAIKHSLTKARVAACLSDTAALAGQQKYVDAAVARGVRGTPTFYLNDQPLPVKGWAEIDRALGALPGGG